MTALYAGIDLHSTNYVLVIADAEGQEVYRKRHRNDLPKLISVLAPYQDRLADVVVESTYNWYWLVDGLMEQGYRLHLANTGAIQKYVGLKHVDDNSDALWLAEMLRLNILPEGHIYPKEERAIRDLLRKRAHLVRQRTANLLSAKNIIARNSGVSFCSRALSKLSDEEIDGLYQNANLALAIKASVRTIGALDEQITLIEKAVLGQVRLRDSFTNLLTISGVGDILALTIMLETGDIHRFPSAGDFASYARCVSSVHSSNGKKKGKGNTKNGNRYLCWAFHDAAAFAIRYNAQIQRYYQRRKDRGKHAMSAHAAVAHKLATACYHMLKTNTVFDVDKAFG